MLHSSNLAVICVGINQINFFYNKNLDITFVNGLLLWIVGEKLISSFLTKLIKLLSWGMYRKNFKQRKISNHNTSSTSFVNPNAVRPPDLSTSMVVPTPIDTVTPQSFRSFGSTTTNNNKRKAFFDDFDLSDLKLDTTLPSFSAATKVSEASFQNMSATGDQSKSLLLDLNDIDFEENIYEDKPDSGDKKINLSDNDKSAMMELVKNDILAKLGNTRGSPLEKEDFSDLLNDDFEIDENDLCELQTKVEQKSSQPKDPTPPPPQPTECVVKQGFQTASGSTITLNPSKIETARSLFSELNTILLKEIACFVWSESNSVWAKQKKLKCAIV